MNGHNGVQGVGLQSGPVLVGQSQALQISHRCRKLQERQQQIKWLKAWQVRHSHWQLGCAMVGLLSLGCPEWDILPSMGGGCCLPVDVEVGNECCPLGGSYIV